jgi:hypothetical protein
VSSLSAITVPFQVAFIRSVCHRFAVFIEANALPEETGDALEHGRVLSPLRIAPLQEAIRIDRETLSA